MPSGACERNARPYLARLGERCVSGARLSGGAGLRLRTELPREAGSEVRRFGLPRQTHQSTMP